MPWLTRRWNLTPFARSQANCFSHASRFGILIAMWLIVRYCAGAYQAIPNWREFSGFTAPKIDPCPFFPVSSHKVR